MSLECQVTVVVTTAVLASLYVATARKALEVPAVTLGAPVLTAIDCTVAAVTVSVLAGLVIPLNDAVIFVVPAATAVATPVPVAAMVAIAGALDAQVTVVVITLLVPSL
jgi:hypothetical protein